MVLDGGGGASPKQLPAGDRRPPTRLWPWQRARSLSVRAAWLEHERYTNRRVTTRGQICLFNAGSPAKYYTLDDGPHRIGLRGESAALGQYAGRVVRVVGRLTFKPGVGIFLDVEQLAPARR
jgi:hypothetical protein